MPKKEGVHARRLKEIEAERRARNAKVDRSVKNAESLRRAADPNAPERLAPKRTLTKKKKPSKTYHYEYK